MSLFIKGINKLHRGDYTARVFVRDDTTTVVIDDGWDVTNKYYAEDVDTPHGDLIDRDAFQSILLDMWRENRPCSLGDIMRELAGMPPVIKEEWK